MMRSILIALALLFGLMSAGAASAQARWQNFGEDPAYASREAALADAERVFIRAGWSAEVSRLMAQKVRTEPCERIELRNGDRLDFMRTGPTGLWRNVLVDFRPYTMNIEAPACRWTLTHDGVTYEAILPDVCNNWAGRRRQAPAEPCIYVVVKAEHARPILSTALLSDTYVDTSECAVSIAGPGQGATGRIFAEADYRPLAEEASHPCDWTAVVQYFGQPMTPIRGCVEIAPGWWAIKLDPSFLDDPDNILVICMTLPNGRNSLSVDVRPQHFTRSAAGVYVATVWESERAVPAGFDWTMLWIEWDHSRFRELETRSRAMLQAHAQASRAGGH